VRWALWCSRIRRGPLKGYARPPGNGFPVGLALVVALFALYRPQTPSIDHVMHPPHMQTLLALGFLAKVLGLWRIAPRGCVKPGDDDSSRVWRPTNALTALLPCTVPSPCAENGV